MSKAPATPKRMTPKRRADITAALDVITELKGRIDLQSDQLRERFKLVLNHRVGLYRAAMLGIVVESAASHADAVEGWARAARRALLNDGGA